MARRWIVVLACAAAGCAHQIVPLTLEEMPAEMTVPVHMLVGVMAVARVRLNDRVSALFLLDTGAPVCAITPKLAKELWETPSQAPPDRTVSLEWGGLKIAKLPVEVRREAESTSDIQGILGCNLFAAFAEMEFQPVAVDPKAPESSCVETQITLRSVASSRLRTRTSANHIDVPLEWYTGHPAVTLRLETADGSRSNFLFVDTGANALTVSNRYEDLFPDEVRNGIPYLQERKDWFYLVPGFRLHGVPLDRVMVGVDLMAGQWPSKISRGSGLLGMNILTRANWMLDFHNQRFVCEFDPSIPDPMPTVLDALKKDQKKKPPAKGGR